MKGLLLKDFYVAAKNLKIYFLIAVVFIGAVIFDKNNVYFLYLLSMLGGIIPMTLLSFDERSGWTKYSLALPYTRSRIVSGKYVIGLILPFAVSVFSAAFMWFIKYSPEEIILFFITSFSLSLAVPAVCLPFAFKLGVEKGRIAYYAALALIIVPMAFLGGNAAENAEPVLIPGSLNIIAMISGIAVLLYIISWLLSIRIMKTKDIS